MTTPGLAEFKLLLEKARTESSEIAVALSQARVRETEDVRKFRRWEQGWLFRKLFRDAFARLSARAEEATALRAELQEQQALARLQTQFDVPAHVEAAFHRCCDEFSRLATAKRVWDTVGHRLTDLIIERTSASRVVERKLVQFRLGRCPLIESPWDVPHLENANGGDIYLYPAFILYFVSDTRFALLEHKEATILAGFQRFIEEDEVPSDAKIVDHTWEKANKNGLPDLRFKENRRLPVARYGKLELKSGTGLAEEYLISNAEVCADFAAAWQAFTSALFRAA